MGRDRLQVGPCPRLAGPHVGWVQVGPREDVQQDDVGVQRLRLVGDHPEFFSADGFQAHRHEDAFATGQIGEALHGHA